MTPNEPHDDRLPGEDGIARAYREAAREQPPAALDARILAAARDAVETAHAREKRRWAIPFSIAAATLLCVGVVFQLLPKDAVEYGELAETAIAPSSDTLAQSADSSASPAAPAPAKRERRARVEAEKSTAAATDAARITAAPNVAGEAIAETAHEPDAVRVASTPAAKSREAASAVGGAGTIDRATGKGDPSDIVGVEVSGAPGAYFFTVRIHGPDDGCGRYNDWWEILDDNGRLLHRALLQPDGAGERPIVRQAGPVTIEAHDTVWVRAHRSSGGYGAAFRGSVTAGFVPASAPEFSAEIEFRAPQPDGCAY